MFRNDFTYKVLDVADIPSQNLLQHLPQSTEWIGNAVKRGGRVLVHCYAGISRSAAIITAFLMSEHKISAECANQLVRKAKYNIYPNPGFKQQLEIYGKLLKSARYQDNQRMRYNEDFTTMSASLLKELRKTSTAGLA